MAEGGGGAAAAACRETPPKGVSPGLQLPPVPRPGGRGKPLPPGSYLGGPAWVRAPPRPGLSRCGGGAALARPRRRGGEGGSVRRHSDPSGSERGAASIKKQRLQTSITQICRESAKFEHTMIEVQQLANFKT